MPIPSLIPVPVFRRGSSSLRPISRSRVGNTFLLKVKDGVIGHYQQFLVGDILRAKVWNGTALLDNWLRVDVVNNPGAVAGYFGYTCTRMSGTAGLIPAGTAIVDYGQSGSSFISLSSDGSIGSAPNITIGKHSGAPWSSTTTLVKLGNLNGDYGISSNLYGFGVGDYSGGNYLRYDPTNGFVMKAGASNVTLDTNGISFSGDTNSWLYWGDPLSYRASIIGTKDTTWSYFDLLVGKSTLGTDDYLELNADTRTGFSFKRGKSSTGSYFTSLLIDLSGNATVIGGLNVGSSTGAATGSIKASNQIQSEVATGTAPLVVASTTAVSNLNADMVDGLHAASLGQTDIGARAYSTAAQSINDVTITTIALEAERWDTDTIHDNVTNNSRLTCKTAGKYVISGHLDGGSAAGVRRLYIWLNGTTYIAVNSGTQFVSISTVYSLAVNDYVELRAHQNSGGAINLGATQAYSAEFAMQKIA